LIQIGVADLNPGMGYFSKKYVKKVG